MLVNDITTAKKPHHPHTTHLTIRALANRIQHLVTRAFPAADQSVIDKEAKNTFLRVLPLNLKREIVRTKIIPL